MLQWRQTLCRQAGMQLLEHTRCRDWFWWWTLPCQPVATRDSITHPEDAGVQLLSPP